MSRAFVKESNGEHAGDELPPRPPRVQPCYMTRHGVNALQREFAALAQRTRVIAPEACLGTQAATKRDKLRLREIARILGEVTPVDVGAQHDGAIRFGATVTLRDGDGIQHTCTIVGEDEVDAGHGLISWVSPLGRQLIGRAVGERVEWARPVGTLEVEITSLEYRV